MQDDPPIESETHSHDSHSLTDVVRAEAKILGFDLVGIAPAVSPGGFNRLSEWLSQGFAGEMSYMPRREDAYRHPEAVLPDVRSLVVVGLNYASPKRHDEPHDASTGRVACYATGSADYHDVLKRRLKQLGAFLHEKQPGCRSRSVVDTAPLLERDFAQIAGLGWFGKNTMLINKRMGSLLFLGALLTDVALEPDEPHHTAHCGTCTRCLEACPTDAFPEPYVLDATKCISYLTIELRDQPIPVELREGMGDWIFGCDVCQDVCPWNRKAPATSVEEFRPVEDLSPARLEWLLSMNADEFRERFRKTPFDRPGRAGILRNAAIAAGNSRDPKFIPVLTRALTDEEPLIREAAEWALTQIQG